MDRENIKMLVKNGRRLHNSTLSSESFTFNNLSSQGVLFKEVCNCCHKINTILLLYSRRSERDLNLDLTREKMWLQ